MKSTGGVYDFERSFERIKETLESSENNYVESDSLPSRDRLTFNNGFYANCSAMFVDIRGSSQLPDKYKRPKLAKLYRAYISEVVAVLDGTEECVEINIVGDGVWGVFNTPYKIDINATFSAAARVNSVIKMLNYLLGKNGYDPIEVGIGLSYGRALMIKAGFQGSGINDVVYMGDVVNRAAKLAAHGNETYFDKTLMISEVFHNNLNEHNRGLLTWHATRNAYHGDVINVAMEDWYNENCT